jgi:predicted MFS family arabinose efflux permease
LNLQKLAAPENRNYIILCVMGAFAILSSTMSKKPVLNPFALSLGTPQDLTGIVAAASTIPGIIISLPAASLSDIFGRRKMLLFSTFIFASAPFCTCLLATGGNYRLSVSTMALPPPFLFLLPKPP